MIAEFFTQQRIARLIMSLIVIAAAVVIWMIFSRTYRRIRQKNKGLVPADGKIGTITSVILNIFKGALILIVIMIVLEINGIKVTSLVAGLGIASAIVGLALQDYLKDVIMGAHILSDDFFQVGEVIRYGTEEGEVLDFNLRSTKIRLLADSSILTISNRNISEIVKLSDQNYLSIPLSYGENAAHAEKILADLCSSAEDEIEGVARCVSLGVGELQDSAVIYKVQMICTPARRIELKRKVLEHLFRGVTEAGLQVPYNQMDVHLS